MEAPDVPTAPVVVPVDPLEAVPEAPLKKAPPQL